MAPRAERSHEGRAARLRRGCHLPLPPPPFAWRRASPRGGQAVGRCSSHAESRHPRRARVRHVASRARMRPRHWRSDHRRRIHVRATWKPRRSYTCPIRGLAASNYIRVLHNQYSEISCVHTFIDACAVIERLDRGALEAWGRPIRAHRRKRVRLFATPCIPNPARPDTPPRSGI